MTVPKPVRPAFQSIELDTIDARLEAKAAEKGIPTLVQTRVEPPADITPQDVPAVPAIQAPRKTGKGVPKEATPRSRMKPLKVELPDYAWIELKKQVAEDMVSLRYFVLDALRAKGIRINEADLVEDGRRFRD